MAHPEFKILITDRRDCEICDYVCEEKLNDCRSYKTMIMCPACLNKELEAEKIIAAGEMDRVARARAPLSTKAEYFNAKTQSIVERRKAIDGDETIKDKNWHEANELMEWLNGSKKALFDLRAKEQEYIDEQNAIQVRLQTLANSLREEQRKELQLKNIDYKPPVSKPTAPKVSKPKFDKVALAAAAKKAVEQKIMPNDIVATAALQTLCMAKKITPDEALKQIAASVK